MDERPNLSLQNGTCTLKGQTTTVVCPTSGGKWKTPHRRQRSISTRKYVVIRRRDDREHGRSGYIPNPAHDTPTCDPRRPEAQERVHSRAGNRYYHEGLAAAQTSKARKRWHYARPGYAAASSSHYFFRGVEMFGEFRRRTHKTPKGEETDGNLNLQRKVRVGILPRERESGCPWDTLWGVLTYAGARGPNGATERMDSHG